MDQIEENPLIIKLKGAMTQRDINPRQLSKLIDIPADRIYKWLQRGHSPKATDVQKLNAWINDEQLEHFPNNNRQAPERDLSKLIENNRLLAEAAHMNARTIAEMWEKINSGRSEKVPLPVKPGLHDQDHKADLGTQGELIVPGTHGVRKKRAGKQQQKGS